MTSKEVLAELQSLGSESYKKLLMKNHGVKEPCFGVKIGDLKKIQKRIKTSRELALELYDSGNYDAMYLAGLIADDARMTRKDLQNWADKAYGGALAGATVAWVAAGSPHGWAMALKWIESSKGHVAAAGWCTLASLVALKPDSDLDLPAIKGLIERVEKRIQQEPDLIRYVMNDFIIAVGSYVKPLSKFALETAEEIGPVKANLGCNQCEVPFAPEHIRKVEKKGETGKKRKMVKC